MNRSVGTRAVLALCVLWSVTAAGGCELASVPIEARIDDYSVSISPESGTVAVGATMQLTATVVTANGDTLAVQVEWASRNPSIATVDSGGIVTGISGGQVEITASYSRSSARAVVQVE